ncbi:hypothetical protein [Streptomyces niveus]|uniref:hypothetical protein n=1 Tax=Streptomyces niveus TaxID=193462 RepID=UPI00084C00A6|nr:hypothetical protein [Streptomyces niveus]
MQRAVRGGQGRLVADQIGQIRRIDPTTVDMMTVVTVGNTATREIAGRMVTPRGYRWQSEGAR